jgi:uncharacterized iron-regulated protein
MSTQRVRAVGAAVVTIALLVAGCAGPAPHAHVGLPYEQHGDEVEAATQPLSETTVLDLAAVRNLAGIVPRLAEKRVVFVGETHDQYAHHLAQLEIIRRLREQDPHLAIGMEAFQQPFQQVLDDYIAGNLSESELLRDSEYFRRWGQDYRLYAPILRYAREQGLPVIALTLPTELTDKVAREGFEALTEAQRAQLPDAIDRSDKAYEQRLKKIFDRHPDSGRGFDVFLDVQLLWDEGMAQQAADWLTAHPDDRLVILAGSGHLAWGSGIPQRLARRLPVDSAVVLNGWEGDLQPELADYVLLTESRTLPPAGKLGVLLDTDSAVLTVGHCTPDSPCARAGLKPGDRFLAIDGEPVKNLTDLRLAMWDKRPGDSLTLMVSRDSLFGAPRKLRYAMELQ